MTDDVTPLLDAGDEPEFPDYDVVDSADLDEPTEISMAELVENLDDDGAAELARQIKASRAAYCHRCPHKTAPNGVIAWGKPARFVLTDENGDARGLCKQHGKKLHRRLNPPTMAVPKGRH